MLFRSGIIAQKGDVDFFRFACKKGEVYDVNLYARRLRSGLDPVLYIHDANGGVLAGSDDSAGPDSYIRFTAPADGEFLVQVVDHLKNGAPDYVYRVELAPVVPFLSLYIPQVDRSSQERQTVPVPRGNRYCALVAANRVNFGGELAVGADGLPEGVQIGRAHL